METMPIPMPMSMSAPGGAELGVIIVMLVFYLIAFLLTLVLPTVAFWKICSKAGFPGALGLLMLVPIANIILPFYLAFAQWPILRANDQTH